MAQEETLDADRTGSVVLDRGMMAAIGAVAGLAVWLFVDVLDDVIENGRLLLLLMAATLGFFSVLLALAGPVIPRRAAIGAACVAGPAAVLAFAASFRFDEVGNVFEAGYPVASYAAMLFIGTPFVAGALREPRGWRNYALLFDLAWIIIVRAMAGWLFVGLIWLALMLSDQLLEIVGIAVIGDLLDVDPVPYLVTGLALGVALSVVHELRAYVSPFLINRLLRLLLPVVVLVVAVFIIGLVSRGIDNLFEGLSTGVVLMSVAIASLTLITTGLDRDDEAAVSNPVMLWSTRVLSVLLPVVSGLAAWAVWLRVGQYGWTPARLAAAISAVFLLIYGLAYAVAVLRGAGWMARIRQVNLWLALAVLVVAAAWLTPLVPPERIAAASQSARIAAMTADERSDEGLSTLPLYEMAQEWGRPGKAALARVEDAARAGGDTALLRALERARTASSEYDFRRADRKADAERRSDELARLLTVRPEGAELADALIDALPEYRARMWRDGCKRKLDDGRAGCVILLGPFRPGIAADQQGFVAFLQQGGQVRIESFALIGKRVVISQVRPSAAPRVGLLEFGQADLIHMLDGEFEVEPVEAHALRLGGRSIIPDN